MYAVRTGDPIFESRSHSRGYTKAEVFETEELTNYTAHAAWVLRHELGDKDPANALCRDGGVHEELAAGVVLGVSAFGGKPENLCSF